MCSVDCPDLPIACLNWLACIVFFLGKLQTDGLGPTGFCRYVFYSVLGEDVTPHFS